jgi:hypothetical protein
MAKQSVVIGYALQEEIRPGVWAAEKIHEVPKVVEVNPNFRHQSTDSPNQNLTTSDEISIIADAFACKNFSNIRYVKYMGAEWSVSSVRLRYPRIILSLGGVYNGRKKTDG